VAGVAHYACPYSSQAGTSYCNATRRLIQISRGGGRSDMDYVPRLKCTCVRKKEQFSRKTAIVNGAAVAFIGFEKSAIGRDEI
jgi:hypothetical protein